MGDYWWLLLIGAGMWSVLLVCSYLHLRHPESNPDACPQCQHEAGLDDRRKHCPEQDDYNGWSSSRCRCQNDYHWNYESTAITSSER